MKILFALVLFSAPALAESMIFWEGTPYGVGGHDCAIYVKGICELARSEKQNFTGKGFAVAVHENGKAFMAECAYSQIVCSVDFGAPTDAHIPCRIPVYYSGQYRVSAFAEPCSRVDAVEIEMPECAR